jgi:peptidoglycan/LPS O-acetylase OafA/YrhL
MAHIFQSSTQPKRRRDLDLIGILVVGGLVFQHTAQNFAPFVSYIKNAPPNFEDPSQLVAALFLGFYGQWGMQLMFFIAGMAVWYSLRKRSAGKFVRERVRRLQFPFSWDSWSSCRCKCTSP